MPNYCNNAGTLTAHNERTRKLFREILDWNNREANEEETEEEDKNFCDFFIPRPDWKSIIEIPEGYELSSGAWGEEKHWLSKEGGPNIPLSDEQKEIIKTKCGGHIGDYDFCSEVWGTKWGLFDEEIEGNENEIDFQGTTAWGPFTTMFENFIEWNNSLPEEERFLFSGEMDYSESGCDFSGRQTIWINDDGLMDCEDNSFTYSEGVYEFDGDHRTLEDPEDYWENIKEWNDVFYEGNNLSEISDGDLLFHDGSVAIMMPSQGKAYVDGVPCGIEVNPKDEDLFFIYE